MSKLIMMVIQNVVLSGQQLETLRAIQKLLLDIELCALEEDGKALAKYGLVHDFDAMIGLIDKKHAEVFKAAKEASIDIIQYGNVETNLKRFLKESILNRYHNLQKAVAFK